MDLKRKFLLFIIPLIIISCGTRETINSTRVFLSQQIASGIPKAYIKNNELISNLKRHQLILDTDGDGILDKDDPDIDGDGISNDCDLAPFDKNIGSIDTDKDGIPDFCDLNPHSDKVPDYSRALLQKKIFIEKGILLVEDNLHFSEEDLSFLYELIERISEKALLPSKKLYTIALSINLALGEYGSYDAKWANIRFTKDNTFSEEFPLIKLWQWVLTHEFFHFVANANPDYYESFQARYSDEQKNKKIAYPTNYSRENEGEYFAELETFQYFNMEYLISKTTTVIH
jgi:hypothetical protein